MSLAEDPRKVIDPAETTDAETTDAATTDAGFESLAARVDAARAELVRLDKGDRALADDALAAIEAFHKPALVTIVSRLRADPRGKELLFELVDDAHVRALLALHGIIRSGPPAPHPAPAPEASATTTLIPIESVKVRRRSSGGWHQGPEVLALQPGSLRTFDVNGETSGRTKVLVVNSAGTLSAFRNECPHQGMPFDRATLQGTTLVCPWHGFRFDATTGECLSAPVVQMETLTVKAEDGHVWVRVP